MSDNTDTGATGNPQAPEGGQAGQATTPPNGAPATAAAPEGQGASTTGQEGQGETPTTTETKPAEGVPEKYEIKLEGDVSVSLPAIEEAARKLNLSNDQAQELATLVVGQVSALTQSKTAEWERLTTQEWPQQLAADPDVGGANLERNGQLAFQAAQKFGGDEFVTALKESGYNQHPAMFKFMAAVGRAMAEDTIVTANQGAQEGETARLASFYPSMQK